MIARCPADYLDSRNKLHAGPPRIASLVERATKFREKACCVSWNPKEGSQEIRNYILAKLTAGAAAANTTVSITADLTVTEIKALKAANKGNYPNRRLKAKRVKEVEDQIKQAQKQVDQYLQQQQIDQDRLLQAQNRAWGLKEGVSSSDAPDHQQEEDQLLEQQNRLWRMEGAGSFPHNWNPQQGSGTFGNDAYEQGYGIAQDEYAENFDPLMPGRGKRKGCRDSNGRVVSYSSPARAPLNTKIPNSNVNIGRSTAYHPAAETQNHKRGIEEVSRDADEDSFGGPSTKRPKANKGADGSTHTANLGQSKTHYPGVPTQNRKRGIEEVSRETLDDESASPSSKRPRANSDVYKSSLTPRPGSLKTRKPRVGSKRAPHAAGRAPTTPFLPLPTVQGNSADPQLGEYNSNIDPFGYPDSHASRHAEREPEQYHWQGNIIQPKPFLSTRDANGSLISARADGLRGSKHNTSRVSHAVNTNQDSNGMAQPMPSPFPMLPPNQEAYQAYADESPGTPAFGKPGSDLDFPNIDLSRPSSTNNSTAQGLTSSDSFASAANFPYQYNDPLHYQQATIDALHGVSSLDTNHLSSISAAHENYGTAQEEPFISHSHPEASNVFQDFELGNDQLWNEVALGPQPPALSSPSPNDARPVVPAPEDVFGNGTVVNDQEWYDSTNLDNFDIGAFANDPEWHDNTNGIDFNNGTFVNDPEGHDNASGPEQTMTPLPSTNDVVATAPAPQNENGNGTLGPFDDNFDDNALQGLLWPLDGADFGDFEGLPGDAFNS